MRILFGALVATTMAVFGPPAGGEQPIRTARRLTHETKPGEHPLGPTLRLVREGLGQIEQLKDYSCNLIRRERIGGKLTEYQYQFLKIRHKPFSAYVYYQAPKRGSEVIFVEGKNRGQLWAHEVGAGAQLVGTVSLDPAGPRAKKESRYPITEAGLMGLARQFAAQLENDMRYGECDVKVFPDSEVNRRRCLAVEITHPTARREFGFHIARVFFDHEYAFPIRLESFAWPEREGSKLALIEEFTFSDLKLNNGFGDSDFDIANRAYNFPRAP